MTKMYLSDVKIRLEAGKHIREIKLTKFMIRLDV